MQQFLVRGLAKVKAVVLWYVLAHNLLRAEALRAQNVPAGDLPALAQAGAAGQERPAGEQGSRSARRLAAIANSTVFQKNSFTDEGRRTSLTKSSLSSERDDYTSPAITFPAPISEYCETPPCRRDLPT